MPTLSMLWSRPIAAKPTRVVFSEPSGYLFVGDRAGKLTCWDAQGERRNITDYGAEVTGLAAWPEGNGVVVGSQDKCLRLVDGGHKQKWKRELTAGVWSVAVDPASKLMVLGTGKTVTAYDHKGEKLWEDQRGQAAISVSMSINGEKIMACANDHLLCYNRQGRPLWKEWFPEPLWEANITADGERVAVGGWDGWLYLFDGQGRLIWRKEIGKQVHGVYQDPEGQIIISGDHEGYLKLWNREGELLLAERVGQAVNSVALNRSMDLLACTTMGEPMLHLYKLTGIGFEGLRPPSGSGEPRPSILTAEPSRGSANRPATPGLSTAEKRSPLPFPGLDAPLPMGLFDTPVSIDEPSTLGPTPPLTPEPTASSTPQSQPTSLFGYDGEPEKAPVKESAFARFSEEVEERSVADQLRLGNAAFDGGRHEEAINYYRRATTADPAEPRGWYNLAVAYLTLQRRKEALTALQKVLQVAPAYAPAQRVVELLARELED